VLVAEPIIHEVSPDHCLASIGCVAVVLWAGETRAEAAWAIRAVIDAVADHYPMGVGVLVIVDELAKIPSRASRDAIAQSMKLTAPRVCCSAVVHESKGVAAAVVRSVASGLALIARQPFPHRIFSTTLQALEWMGPRLSSGTAEKTMTADLLSGVAEIRRRQAWQRAGAGSFLDAPAR
jgi:hypothetical protein